MHEAPGAEIHHEPASRIEDDALIRDAGRFIDDLKLPGQAKLDCDPPPSIADAIPDGRGADIAMSATPEKVWRACQGSTA